MRIKNYFLLALASAVLLGSAFYSSRDTATVTSNSNQIEKVDGSIEPLCTDQDTQIRTLAELRKSKIDIEIPKSRKWASNIVAAKTSTGKAIGDEFKKKFKARIYITSPKKAVCIFNASVRISGDWRDHLSIKSGQPIASIDVQLEEGNLAGIVDFKLLLPKTRGGDNEVIMSLLMRKLDILAPRTGYIDTTVNGIKVQYLFQENTEKELVESQNRREAPLYESDESMFWIDRVGDMLASDIDQRIIVPKSTNSKWIGDSDNRAAITKRGIDILMSAYSSYWQTRKLYPELISNGNSELLQRNNEFISLMLAANAEHGLITHNRRFFFDPMRNGLEPIYYDGDADLLNSSRKLFGPDYPAHQGALTLLPKLKNIDVNVFTEELRNLGADIDSAKSQEIIDELLNRLTGYANANVPAGDAPTWKANNFLDLNNKDRRLVFAHNKENATVCSFELTNCKPAIFTIEEYADLIGGKLTQEDNRYIYVGANQADYVAGNAPQQDQMTESALYDINFSTQMLVAGQANVEISQANKTITVTATAAGSRLHIQNGNLESWTLNYQSVDGLEATAAKDRFDDRLLTGCVTIADTELKNTTFNISNALCEDGINFVRSSGQIASLSIDGTLEDGLDMDFSNLTISNLHVANTGNDCLDLSAGNYEVTQMVLDNCGDKGMSIGEVATVKLAHGKILGVGSIGIAVKDWSVLDADAVELQGAQTCVSLYRKKQEFGASQATFTSLTCSPMSNALQTHTVFRNGS